MSSQHSLSSGGANVTRTVSTEDKETKLESNDVKHELANSKDAESSTSSSEKLANGNALQITKNMQENLPSEEATNKSDAPDRKDGLSDEISDATKPAESDAVNVTVSENSSPRSPVLDSSNHTEEQLATDTASSKAPVTESTQAKALDASTAEAFVKPVQDPPTLESLDANTEELVQVSQNVSATASTDAAVKITALTDAMTSAEAVASTNATASTDATASTADAMASKDATAPRNAATSTDTGSSSGAVASTNVAASTDATITTDTVTSRDAMASTNVTASTDAKTPDASSTQALQSNNNATPNTEDQRPSEAAPVALLRPHNRNVERAHHSVISCPEVIEIVAQETGQGNRRHSMDIFDIRNRLKKKKGLYKTTDISGPICSAGDGPSATMKTRSIRTANSDSNLLENVSVSSLTVNMTEYTLNEPDQPPLIISWDIASSISSLDCISLYLRREDNVPELVSFRNAGVGYMPKGEITWDLNQHQEKFTSEENFVVFKYYHPTSTGGLSLVAATEQVTVYNRTRPSPSEENMRSVIPAPLISNSDITTLVLSDLCGYNLKRGVFFNPDPYVKISVFPGPRCAKQPHHKQLYRTKQAGNTINPVWKEHFMVQVLPTDLVELEVKDRFERSRPILRRFLGRLLIPVHKLQDVIGQGDERFTEALGKRTPIDQTSGSLSFLVTTARRNIPSAFNLGNAPSNRSSVRSVATSEESTSDTQMSTEEENYSSDGSANSEQADVTAPEYVPNGMQELPNGSAVAVQNGTGEDAMEMDVSPEQSETQESENSTKTTEQDDTQMSSTNETAESESSEQTQIAEASNTSDIIDGAVVKNTVITALKESSPSPIPSPRERSPMRKNRLGAVSFFPDETPPTSQDLITSFSTRTVSSLKNMSLQVIAKKAEEKDNAESASQNKRTVPSLMRLTSLELEQRYGAVGGASNFDRFYPAPDDAQANCDPKTESIKQTTSFKQNTANNDIDETLSTPPEVPPKKKRTSLSDNSPVNEVLSITIHRTGKRPLGLSIIGGSNSTKPNGKHIFVKNVELGSPAAEAGVQVNDRILAVNSQSMVNAHHNKAVSVIRDSGDEVIMQVERKLNAATKRRYSSNTIPAGAVGKQALSTKPKPPPLVTSFRKGVLPPKVSVSSGAVKLPSAFDARFRASRHRIMSRTDITPEHEIPSQEGLPPNWESFKDRHGRIYYVDHENRTTQWNHPTKSPGEPARGEISSAIPTTPVPGAATIRRRNSTEGDRNYESAMKRYQSIKRAMKRQSRVIGEEEESESSRKDVPDEAVQGIHSPLSAVAMEEEEDTRAVRGTVVADSATPEDAVDSRVVTDALPKKDNSLSSPGCRFLTHPGFRDLLVQNAEALALYQSNSVLKYMITKVGRDPKNFQQYQHNKELVKFINMFGTASQELPQGWETRKDQSGKAFFIDHNHKLTTFIDPRLPLINTSSSQPKPEPERPATTANEDESRGPVQSPVATDQPPPIPPRPQQTITEQSGRVESRNNGNDTDTTSQDAPTAYNEKVLAFLRQPNIIDILKERHPEVGTSNSLNERIMIIRTEGVTALERLSYSVNLTLMLSKFEDEIMNFVPNSACRSAMRPKGPPGNNSHQGSPVPSTNEITKAITRVRQPAPYRRDFESKLHNFYRKLDSKGYGKGPNKIKMQVRRDHLLEDAFQKVKSLTRKELQRSKLNISFAGEEGLDYSGPSREFFFLVSRELFNPYYGLFEYSAVDTYTVQISPMSAYIDDPMDWFRFAGRIIGLALIHHYLLDAFFTRPLYKALLRAKCDISDLQYIDEQFYNSLMWMKDNDITDVLDLTFTADEEVFGQVVERELKPNGKNIAVTEKNKKDYIERIVKWRVNRSCREQTNQIVRGFNEVIDLRLVSVFDARELELVLCGTAEIDLNDWRQNTEYRGGYHDLHPVIQWFWEALQKFDNETRLRLLQFVTGTSSIPYEGFSALRGPNGPKKFCIEKWGKVHFLPRAHTCFNRVDLPPYPSFEILWEKLTIAVEETSTFGIE